MLKFRKHSTEITVIAAKCLDCVLRTATTVERRFFHHNETPRIIESKCSYVILGQISGAESKVTNVISTSECGGCHPSV